ncbi:MAG: hypothetical protein ACRCYU_21300 [Nocardioides sp.]
MTELVFARPVNAGLNGHGAGGRTSASTMSRRLRPPRLDVLGKVIEKHHLPRAHPELLWQRRA